MRFYLLIRATQILAQLCRHDKSREIIHEEISRVRDSGGLEEKKIPGILQVKIIESAP